MSREIVEILIDNEYIRKELHTCICEQLTAEQIKELYLEVLYKFENSNQLKLKL